MTFGLAWSQVRPSLGRLGIAIAAIALGVALGIAILLSNQTLYDSFAQSIRALAGRGDLQVIASGGGAFDEKFLEVVRGVPGVKSAAPLVVGSALFVRRPGEVARIVGVDMLDEATAEVYGGDPTKRAGIEDPLLLLSQTDSVIATEQFAREYELRSGDALELSSAVGPRRLVIRGIMPAGEEGQGFAANLLVMDLVAAQDTLASVGRLSQIDIRVADDVDENDVAERLRAALPAYLEVADSASRQATLGRTLAGFQRMLDSMGLLGLLLAGLIVANRLSTIYQARLWELGVMRALGTSPGRLVCDLLVEALIVASVGVLLAIPLGILLAQVVVQPISNTLALNFKESFSVPSVSLRAGPLALACAAGILGALIAAFRPARKAVRLCVAAVLVQGRGGVATRRWSPFAIGLLSALGVVGLLALLAAPSEWAASSLLVLAPLAAFLCLSPGLAWIGSHTARVFGPAAEVGAASQARLRGRTTGAAGILMGGVAMLVWVASTARSFEGYVVSALMGSRQGDIIVTSKLNDDHVGDVVRYSEEALAEIAALPGVEAVSGESYMLSAEDGTGVLGVDASRMVRPEFGVWDMAPGAMPDALGRVARGEAIMASRVLLARRGVSVGDVLPITTPAGRIELPVAAEVTASFLSQTGDAVVSRDVLRLHWPEAQLRQTYVLVRSDASRDAVAAEIDRRLGERYGVHALSTGDLASFYGRLVRRGFAFLDSLGLLTLFVVLLGTGDALAAEVLQRSREIGTMRAVGASRGDISRAILAQALAVGLVGGLLGIPLGFAMSYAYIAGVVPGTLGWQIAFQPGIAGALSAAALGVLACMLGSLLPALRAARLSPLVALRSE